MPTAHIRNTTTQQALPATQVNAITLDPDHGVWLGTDLGLLYSDGATIRSVSLGQAPSTLHARPRNIAVDTLGRAWVVTAHGVQLLPAHSLSWQDVTDFDLGPGLNQWPMGTLAAAREGGIWATHGQDLWRFGGPATTLRLTAPLPEPGCRLIHLTVDPDGNVWSPLSDCIASEIMFSSKTGEWRFDPPDSYSPQLPAWQSTNPPDVGTIRDETVGPDGRVWIVGDRGIAVYDPKGTQP
jgi:ligand-binding sensor domain-containing protein